MSYTEAPNNAATYSEKNKPAAWDDGVTVWDASGNPEDTSWDIRTKPYTEQSTNTVTWTES